MILNLYKNDKTYYGRGEGLGAMEGGRGYRSWRGGGGGEKVNPSTTRMTSALRWAAMRAILVFY